MPPCPFMRLLLRKVMDPEAAPDSHENRTRVGMLAGWVSGILSILLAVVKAWFGWVSGSVSMMADATNNLTDIGSSLVIALSFQWSRKPRDEKHPFGHGRIEAVSTLVLSLALILVGVEVAKSGISRLIHPQPIEAPVWLLVALGVTIVVKSWMAIFAQSLARITQSQTLKADAWNHSFDVICTLMVVLALICSRMGWGALDGWMAVGVSLFILYTGISYARETIDILLGKRPESGVVRRIFKTVSALDEVVGVHDIVVHQYGDVHMVSFHIEVDAGMSLLAAHQLSEDAESVVEDLLGWRAVAHVDPVDRSHSLFNELLNMLKTFVAQDSRLVDLHDLRVEGSVPQCRVSFDLVADMNVLRSEYDALLEDSRALFVKTFNGRVHEVDIGLEAAMECAPMTRKSYKV